MVMIRIRLRVSLNPTPVLVLTLSTLKIEFQAAMSKSASHITLDLLKGCWVTYWKKSACYLFLLVSKTLFDYSYYVTVMLFTLSKSFMWYYKVFHLCVQPQKIA